MEKGGGGGGHRVIASCARIMLRSEEKEDAIVCLFNISLVFVEEYTSLSGSPAVSSCKNT